MKYLNTMIGFREFPDEISLCINISGCQFRCPDCHSKELWENVGKELSSKELYRLISINNGITCIGFMGGIPKKVNKLAEYVKSIPLKVGWYWGGTSIPKEINIGNFDYIKTGPYIKERGGLDNPNTNQRMFSIDKDNLNDITYKFHL